MNGEIRAMDVATEIVVLSDDDGSVKGDDVIAIEKILILMEENKIPILVPKRRRPRVMKVRLKVLTWYPHLKEDEIANACPMCCDNCNCKACLRSSTLIK
ncbi:lysine-specific demethylase 3B, partial [Trifolium pratense]